MRLFEKCPCGGEIEVNYDIGKRNSFNSADERGEAKKQVDSFRRRHRDCLPARETPNAD